MFDPASGGLAETVMVAEMIAPCMEKIALHMWTRVTFTVIPCRIAVEEVTRLLIDVIGGQHIEEDNG